MDKFDALAPAIPDTTGKTELEKELIARIDELSNSSPKTILAELTSDAIQFGLKLLAAVAIFFIGAWLIKIIRRSLKKSFERRKADAAVASFSISLISATAWVLLIIISVGTLGVETTSLAALLAAGGMAIGMALSGTVQNFAGGLMILIFKPFKAGDFIEAQGYSGTVSEINITSTQLITPDNKVIILPNGSLQSGNISNFSKLSFRRVDFTVSVEYGTDSELVRNTLLEIAASDARILGKAQGAPADCMIALSALADSSVNFIMRVWVKTEDYWDVFFATNEKIYTTLPRKGAAFPFPQLTVHLDK